MEKRGGGNKLLFFLGKITLLLDMCESSYNNWILLSIVGVLMSIVAISTLYIKNVLMLNLLKVF